MQENGEKEVKIFTKKYAQLLKACSHNTSKEDRKMIRKAFSFAIEAHKGMNRKSGEPYVFHPIEVAIITVKEIGLGATSIIAALLHDVVEDTEYTIDDIRSIFGEKIARIVDGLTKISGIFKTHETFDSIQAANFKKILLTLSDDMRVILVKLADRLHNMRTLDSLAEKKQIRISSETSYFYAPLAHRLGFYAIKNEMEDLVLKYTNRPVYDMILRKLTQSESERNRFVNSFILPIKQALESNGMNFKIVKRVKSINSIYNKMLSKQVEFEDIYDIFAIRIIVDSIEKDEHIDCLKALGIVEGIYKRNPDRFRNWLSTPKANGYQALHTTVMSKTGQWVEVQIRSLRMDEIAEKGYAAHWKYKNSYQTYEAKIEEWLNNIREHISNPAADAVAFLDKVRSNFFGEEIYVFTPKGDLKTIPNNYTALDFAYYLHSNIGNKAIGAKVNTLLVPLSYILKNGDQVEILTSEKQTPKEGWLQFVFSPKAISFIKQHLKEEKKQKLKEGKEILQGMFEQLGVEFSDKFIEMLRHHLKYSSQQALLLEVYNKNIQVREIKTAFKQRGASWKDYFFLPFTRNKTQTQQTDEKNIAVDETVQDESLNKIVPATCCNPIPGDEIIGFRQYESIVVHRTSCKKATVLFSTYGHKMVNVTWSDTNMMLFLTSVKIEGIDKIGIIRDVSRVISEEMNVNIRTFHLESKEGTFEGVVTLFISDVSKLKNLMKKLSKIEGVNRVLRTV